VVVDIDGDGDVEVVSTLDAGSPHRTYEIAPSR